MPNLTISAAITHEIYDIDQHGTVRPLAIGRLFIGLYAKLFQILHYRLSISETYNVYSDEGYGLIFFVLLFFIL